MKKLTNVVALEMVLGLKEVKDNKELFEKIEKLKTQLEKKSGGKKKPTKTQIENDIIKEYICGALAKESEAMTIKELQLRHEDIGTDVFSNQKISALLRQLVADGIVERVEEKRVAKFKIIKK